MNENKNPFLKQLDELISLFEKLKDKAILEGILLENDPLYKNFEMLSGNYKLIKDNIPEELIEELGEPIKQMISEMIVQLKTDLNIKEDDLKDESFKSELEKIDELLKSGNLNENQIDELLDKRAQLNTDKE